MYAQAELIERLRLICGDEHLLTAPGELFAYTAQPLRGSVTGPGSPLAVVLPGTLSEVVAVVAACSEAQVPYSVRGAGTERVSGSWPSGPVSGHAFDQATPAGAPAVAAAPAQLANFTAASFICVALTRLRRIANVNVADTVVTAEPGVPVATLRRAVGPGRTVLPDLPHVPAATVGGVLAGGAGRESLTAVELLMPDGSVAEIDAGAPGYDLCGAFVGSAGRDGIAVKLTLRIYAEPVVA